MKVIIEGMRFDADELQSEFPDVEFHFTDDPEEQKTLIKDADAYYGRPSPEVFREADKLRWIQNPGTGINFVMDHPELVNSDVVLTNMRGTHAPPMADHVFAMILQLAHRMSDFMDDQRARRWQPTNYSNTLVDLEESTIGIMGMGGIGKACARRAIGFGMEVHGVDLHPYPAPPGIKEIVGLDRLDDVLKIVDWFVITVPLTHESKGSIDRRRIELMKHGAYLVVISRGGIIDEEALLDALKSGNLAGAGLDVTATEPLPEDSPLWDAPNLILTPHASATTPSVPSGRGELFKENLRRFMNDEPLMNMTNKVEGF